MYSSRSNPLHPHLNNAAYIFSTTSESLSGTTHLHSSISLFILARRGEGFDSVNDRDKLDLQGVKNDVQSCLEYLPLFGIFSKKVGFANKSNVLPVYNSDKCCSNKHVG